METYGRRGLGWEGQGTEIAEHNPLVSTRLQPDPKGLWGGGQPAVAPPRGQGYLYLTSGKSISEPSAPHPQPFQGAEWGTTPPQKSLQRSMDYETHLGAETQISFYNDFLALFFFFIFFDVDHF